MISDYKLARSTAINFLTGGKNIEELSSNNIQLEEEIIKTIDSVFKIQPKWMETVNRLALIKDLKQHLTIFIPGEITCFSDNDSGRHIPWLEEKIKSGDLKWSFWTRYEEYLLNQSKMAPLTIDGVNNQTSTILSQIEDPDREGNWDIRGVVVGSVQSGKTANYCGLIAKAIDAGYKRIVVLCGLNNDLRSQTQERIEEGIIGEIISNKVENRKIGVGTLGYDIPFIQTATTRDDDGDFSKKTAKQFTSDKKRPFLLLIKKNVSVLENLLYWIYKRDCELNYNKEINWDWRRGMRSLIGEDLETEVPVVHNTPLLVIDDECDQASLDTYNQFLSGDDPDRDHDPSKTNQMIRRLLMAYPKSAYIGYTATPFANIFIDRRQETIQEGPDLWPRDFIINIPTPSHYIGPKHIFYDPENEEDVKSNTRKKYIQSISDHAEWTTDKKGQPIVHKRENRGWMPPAHTIRHIPKYNGKETIPPSLRRAVCFFLLGCAVRKLRGYDEGNTMLVHVSRFVNVNGEVGGQISHYLKDIKSALIGRENDFEEIRKIWKSEYSLTINQNNDLPGYTVDYKSVQTEILEMLDLNMFEVGIMDGSSEHKKQYDLLLSAKKNIISVGGQRLSRGLTLKSLIVSYFLRSAQSPLTDTMTQMGRWFGYRVGYEDICRLFIPIELEILFREYAETESNLRARIADMFERGKTPTDYKMMMERHPGWSITSRAKLRKTRTIQIDFNAYHGQTVVLYKKEENKKNIEATYKLLSQLRDYSRGRKTKGNHYLWRNVDSKLVLDFIKSYITHVDNGKFRSETLAMYIENMNETYKELNNWSVGVISGGGNNGFIDKRLTNLPINYLIRATNQPDNISEFKHQFQNLDTASDEAFDLSELEYNKAMESYRPRRQNADISERIFYRWVRGIAYDSIEGDQELIDAGGKPRGLLLIYPVVTKEKDTSPLIGISISFPKSKNSGHGLWTISQYDFEKMNELY